MTSTSFQRNPFVEALFRPSDDGRPRVDISAFSLVRGGIACRFIPGETPGYDAALSLLTQADQTDSRIKALSPQEAIALWSAGLIVTEPEIPNAPHAAACLWAPDLPLVPSIRPRRSQDRSEFAAQGYVVLSDCVTPQATQALNAYYRMMVDCKFLQRGDSQADRYKAHNDLAGRRVQRALHDMVEELVGSPIKASYCYTSLYCGGTDLALHKDRPQCKYTLSVLLDYRPKPHDNISPCPVLVYPDPPNPGIACFQSIGGGLLFRGSDIAHARPRFPATHECWVLLLHYVDADFSGALE